MCYLSKGKCTTLGKNIRRILGFFVLTIGLVSALSLVNQKQEIRKKATGNTSVFVVTEDATRGHVSIENDAIALTWQYGYIAEEGYNQGGGNIYAYYDKRVDPTKQYNLVGVMTGGTGGTGPTQAGRGGLGSTKVYMTDAADQYDQLGIFDNARSSGTLVSKWYEINPTTGDFTVFFEINVGRQVLNDPNFRREAGVSYSIEKSWRVTRKGVVYLTYRWFYKASGYTSEPAYNFSFNRSLDWQSASWYSHYGTDEGCRVLGDGNSCPNEWSGVGSLEGQGNLDIGTGHGLFYELSRSASGRIPSIRLEMDNGGKGFDGGGLYQHGVGLWRVPWETSGEFSSYRTGAYGHTFRWFGWWGGANGRIAKEKGRYKYIQAGTTWTDTIRIYSESVLSATEPPSVSTPVPAQSPTPSTVPSPTGVGGANPRGVIGQPRESFECSIEGWAIDNDAPNSSVLVKLYDSEANYLIDRPFAQPLASIDRSDLCNLAAGQTDCKHGYRLSLEDIKANYPDLLSSDHTLYIKAVNIGPGQDSILTNSGQKILRPAGCARQIGDASGDFSTGIQDYTCLKGDFFKTSAYTCLYSDLNLDSRVGLLDLNKFISKFVKYFF